MLSVLSTEFLKLRRSKMLLLAVIASILPGVVKSLQYNVGKGRGDAGWEWFLASGQELMVLGMLTVVVLISSFIFNMEYQYNTAPYIFTSRISKGDIFIAKMFSLLAMIAFLFATAALSQLLLGFWALKAGLPWDLFLKFAGVITWYIFSYFLLSAVVVLISVCIKRFVLSAVAVLGYLIMVFPFHFKNPYACPFMTPTVVAAKLYGTTDYIFTNYYQDISVNYMGAVGFLTSLALVSFMVGMTSYQNKLQ